MLAGTGAGLLRNLARCFKPVCQECRTQFATTLPSMVEASFTDAVLQRKVGNSPPVLKSCVPATCGGTVKHYCLW